MKPAESTSAAESRLRERLLEDARVFESRPSSGLRGDILAAVEHAPTERPKSSRLTLVAVAALFLLFAGITAAVVSHADKPASGVPGGFGSLVANAAEVPSRLGSLPSHIEAMTQEVYKNEWESLVTDVRTLTDHVFQPASGSSSFLRL